MLSTVISNTRVSRHTFVLKVERPNTDIRAGQCFNIGLAHSSVNREYSMYSDAHADFIEFLIREVDDGVVSPQLAAAKTGDHINLFGPYGDFCIDRVFKSSAPADERRYLFIGTGTGIAPFRSYIKTFTIPNYLILHGTREADENYGAPDYCTDKYRACISNSEVGRPGFRVTDALKDENISYPDIVFICGNRKMIADVYDILRAMNISSDNIFTEAFF